MTSPIITEAEKDVLKSKDFNIYTSEGLVVRLEYNPWFAILHFKEIAKLDRKTYTFIPILLEDISEFLKDMGYEHVYSVVHEGNKVINKLALRVGMEAFGKDGDKNVYRKEV